MCKNPIPACTVIFTQQFFLLPSLTPSEDMIFLFDCRLKTDYYLIPAVMPQTHTKDILKKTQYITIDNSDNANLIHCNRIHKMYSFIWTAPSVATQVELKGRVWAICSPFFQRFSSLNVSKTMRVQNKERGTRKPPSRTHPVDEWCKQQQRASL